LSKEGSAEPQGVSPASSGPAGPHFEAQVGASYLLAMLTGGKPRGLWKQDGDVALAEVGSHAIHDAVTDSVLWTWCSTSACRHVSPTRGVLMFPPSLQRVPWPPLAGPCGSPPSQVLWGRTTAPPSVHGHLWFPLAAGTSVRRR
jgi:hypothetical protein